MDRPLAVSNRSISNCTTVSDSHSHSNSSESYSLCTSLDESKISIADNTTSSNCNSYYQISKAALNDLGLSSQHTHASVSNELKKMSPAVSRIHRRRANNHPHDRLAVTLHSSDFDLKSRGGLRPRAGLDRQQSISRWMADTVNEHCGKIRRAVSSHETILLASSSTHSRSRTSSSGNIALTSKRPLSPESGGDYSMSLNTSSKHNAPFRLFRRQNSHNPLSKPVRKRSSGPEGLLQDVLRALSGHERAEGLSSHHSRKLLSGFGKGNSNHSHTSHTTTTKNDKTFKLDEDDIEEDTDEEDVEFQCDSVDTDANLNLNDTPSTTLSKASALVPLLSQQSLRWEASSPSRELEKSKFPNQALVPNDMDRLNVRCSSKTMPVPPPPPFSPANSRSSGIDAVPNDLFQPGTKTAADAEGRRPVAAHAADTSPNPPVRMTSNHLRDTLSQHVSCPPLAPLAAASAAIAIATDSCEDMEEEEEEEGCLNDLVPRANKSLTGEGSSHDYKTDAATADSAENSSRNTWDDDDDDEEEISVDGSVSMLSASNASSFQFSTHRSIENGTNGGGGTGLAAYMNKVQRELEETKKKTRKSHSGGSSSNNSHAHNNKGNSLASYMNYVKHKEEEETCNNSRSNRLDMSYKSIAESTLESGYTFATEGYGHESPSGKKARLPLQLMAVSDHHPLLTPRREASIVPPSMPKRSVSNHEKLDGLKTPSASTDNSPVQSPSDRMQRLLDLNKYKSQRRSSLGENHGSSYNANPGGGPHNQRFRRRVTMSHTPCSGSSMQRIAACTNQNFRRRVSLDHSTTSSTGSSVRPRRASLDSADTTLSSRSGYCSPPFLTPTITKTPRTSPSIGKHRKRLDMMATGGAADRTPTSNRNLTSMAPSLHSTITEESGHSLLSDYSGSLADSSDRWKGR